MSFSSVVGLCLCKTATNRSHLSSGSARILRLTDSTGESATRGVERSGIRAQKALDVFRVGLILCAKHSVNTLSARTLHSCSKRGFTPTIAFGHDRRVSTPLFGAAGGSGERADKAEIGEAGCIFRTCAVCSYSEVNVLQWYSMGSLCLSGS